MFFPLPGCGGPPPPPQGKGGRFSYCTGYKKNIMFSKTVVLSKGRVEKCIFFFIIMIEISYDSKGRYERDRKKYHHAYKRPIACININKCPFKSNKRISHFNTIAMLNKRPNEWETSSLRGTNDIFS